MGKYILALLIAAQAHAVELSELKINYKRFHPRNRIAEIPGFQAKEGLSLWMSTDLYGPVYWDNQWSALTDYGSYRFAEWKLILGVKLHPRFKIQYEHKSGHLLDHTDRVYPAGKFPVQDSIGFEWKIY